MSTLQDINKSQILILVVDDDTTNVTLLSVILQKLGYNVVTAYNGQEAVDQFVERKPDLVLMDIMMPVMNGYESTRLIKEKEGEDFVPIIFITALNEDKALAKCIESGGNDFLVKPYNPILIESKINSFLHLRGIYQSEKEKTKDLTKHGEWLENEYRISRQVINKILKKEALHESQVRYKISPKAIFNGDILMVEETPDNVLRIFIGDFTGHGMSGAIGSIPVAGIFTSMTEKGFSIEMLVKEINKRLLSVMPSGIFLAAAIIDYNPRERRVTIWNGGSPEIFIYSKQDKAIKEIAQSKNYPFAVVDNGEMGFDLTEVYVEPGDRLFGFTDGVLSTVDKKTNSIKDTGVLEVVASVDDETQLFEKVVNHLNVENSKGGQIDDITMFELCVYELEGTQEEVVVNDGVSESHPSNASCKVNYILEASVLKRMDPLPMLVQSLGELGDIEEHKQAIYLIARELFANALEHGLLKLDSRIKQQEGGFQKFFDEKDERLASLDKGSIEISVSIDEIDGRKRVDIVVTDSGDGFDFSEMEKSELESSYHGRGLALINNLCGKIKYNDKGNEATATYTWVSEQ